ncbi:unnamed protein product [Taenia asiatica]|uniref:Uncharacterized protein n=1 Tax=Taenia asiatica TaxID=60517 RepID=A0A0R3WG81_TAEAS|nr:unnamed protein product [Taenia asiatica]
MHVSKVDASATETSSGMVDEVIYNAAMVDTSMPRVGGDSDSSISNGADSEGKCSPLDCLDTVLSDGQGVKSEEEIHRLMQVVQKEVEEEEEEEEEELRMSPLVHALRCLGVLRMGLLCGLVLVPPRPGPCYLTSTAVLFGDLVVDGDSGGGGRGFLRGAVRRGAVRAVAECPRATSWNAWQRTAEWSQ